MKNFLIRSHNVKSKTLPTWPTPNDKTPETVIYDEENGYAFVITFGPNPEISIWDKSDKNNLGNEIHRIKVSSTFGRNGGVDCDTDKGPCACGAWHGI